MANILLIEDNADITFAVSMGLQRAGHQVFAAESEAQGKAAYVRVKPELVLLDYNLPDGSGESVCQWLKSQSNTPIIFLTVRDEENDVVHGLELGADDYITKPFSLAILLSRVAAVLRRALPSRGRLFAVWRYHPEPDCHSCDAEWQSDYAYSTGISLAFGTYGA